MSYWQARDKCPFCGSNDLEIGSGYQDEENGEMSSCNSCGSSWGGAMYWK